MLEKLFKYQLKAQAHALKPVVFLGAKGLTPEVMVEIGYALLARELIKVKLAGVAREDKMGIITAICAALQAESVQLVGHIVTLYRKNSKLVREKKPVDRKGRELHKKARRAKFAA